MRTKEVLYRTRDLSWGSDTSLYRSAAEFAGRFPARLGHLGRLVVKQCRGNGGNGVWKVELPGGEPGSVGLDSVVRVQDARSTDGSQEFLALGSFIRRCEVYFTWSGCLVDQAFQDRLADGMLRCYFSGSQVVGFRLGAPPNSVFEGPEAPAYQLLRAQAETLWVPQMISILGLDPHELPVIWDADFLYGPTTPAGADTYVLCEINVSAVWPFPPMAAPTVAATALHRIRPSRPLSTSTRSATAACSGLCIAGKRAGRP